MKKLFIIAILLFSVSFSAQIMGENEVYLKGELIEPRFNGGGLEVFRDYVYGHIDKTKVKQAGKVVFTFDIAETGEIKNIRIIEFKDMDFATEVIRVLKLAPKWIPASRNGKTITLNIKFPVEFKLKLK
ncbi:MAG: energy transducer TonB [Bacteroidota bacterium]